MFNYKIFCRKTNDNRIAVAKNLSLEEQEKEDGKSVILVSKDVLVRVKADAIGLKAEDYLSDRVIEVENIYSGFLEGYISKEQLDYFMKKVSCLYLKLQIILLSQSICSNERRIRGI